jgi:hypothetical protein
MPKIEYRFVASSLRVTLKRYVVNPSMLANSSTMAVAVPLPHGLTGAGVGTPIVGGKEASP